MKELLKNWEWKKLGEVAEIIMGQSPPSNTYNDKLEGLPFFQGKAEFGARYPEVRKYCSNPVRVAEAGDILMSVRAPVGSLNIAKAKSCIGRGLCAISPSNKLNQLFLFHYLRSIENIISAKGEGSTFTAINRKNIERLEIPLPPLPIQRKIVAILERAEKLKNLRQEANEETNTIIQALFYEMFGEIKLEDYNEELFEIIDGDRGVNYPKSTDFLNEGYCLFLTTKNVRPDGFNFEELQFVDKRKDEQLRKGRLKRSDLVLTTRGTIGNVALYDETVNYNIIRINSGMVVIRPNLKLFLPRYLLYLIQMPVVQNQFRKITSGTAQPQLPIKTLKQIKIPIPPISLQDQFASLVEKIESIKQHQTQSTEEINTLFNALMQKAFNGELVA